MIYYISDLHLGHENIIRLCGRPYLTIDMMNEDLILNWNLKVKESDTIYILGDLFFKAGSIEYVKSTLKRLKGH